MYELLIRIETLCIEANPLTLLGVGAVATIVGLLLLLAGAYFSSAIIGMLGAVVGAFCGLLLSQWLDINALLTMAIGSAVLCIAAVLMRNIIIIVLAIIVFALAGGTTYSSFILAEPEQAKTMPGLSAFDGNFTVGNVLRFSDMDPAMRLSYLNQIAEKNDGFFEKLKALLRDTIGTMSPHKWKLLLTVLGGAIVGFILIWLLKALVVAISCSGVGALLVLVGAESLLMALGFEMCNALRGNRLPLTIVYFSMVGVGTIFQLLLARSHKLKKVKAEKK